MIINPNAALQLAAPLPSDPSKAASYAVPLDPSTQGVRRFSPDELGIAIWVLTACIHGLNQQVDRLERLLAATHDRREPTGATALEDHALAIALVADVQARREAEAKARADLAQSGRDG